MLTLEAFISVAFWFSTFITLLIIFLPSRSTPTNSQFESESPSQSKSHVTVQILVLGDIGRSPRMQYHALSIANCGGLVDVVGYHESDPHPDITSNPGISIVPLPPHPAFLQTGNRIAFLLYGPLKAMLQASCLWYCLAYRAKPAKWLLVQNPPSIPVLAVASAVCFLRRTRMIIDWHNFGYSILALKLGSNHPLVRLSQWYEKFFSQFATAHLCVTEAMARVLKQEFPIRAPILPLHDRPASHFRPISDNQQRLDFLLSLPETEEVRHELKNGNVKILVSPTSWTPDEDFSIFIDALCHYSAVATTNKIYLPRILAIITGKGPQKDMYLQEIERRRRAGDLQMVIIRTSWLTSLDYATLLASATLGVSLHTSSSGVDLPMKVVDMFGAGLPVLGWDQFEAWPELVTNGVNGRGFGNSQELADHLINLFGNPTELEILQIGAYKEGSRRWDDEWRPVAGRLLGLV